MTVPNYTRPNFTEPGQDGSTYRTNLDTAAQLAERLGLAFLPQAQAAPNMTVRVLAGALLVDGALTEIAAQNTGTITAPVTNPRIDRVVIDAATGAVSVVTGTENASPVAPAIPSGKLPVARVALATSTTQITASLLTDERARPTGTAALRDVGTGADQVPTNSMLTTGTGTIVAGESWTAPVAIYLDYANTRGGGADRWYKIDTDATAPVRISKRVAIALANAASAGDSVLAQLRPGRVSGFTSLTAGLPVWASATAGAVTQTDPSNPSSGTQAISRLLGYAASATEIDFDPEQDTSYFGRQASMAVDATFTIEHYPDPGAVDRRLKAYLVDVSTNSFVAGATGTPIGNMTAGGGLPAAFNGTSEGQASGAVLASGSGDATCGKDWGSGNTKTIGRYRLRAPADSSDFSSGGGSASMKLQGSTDNFSSSVVDLHTGSTGSPGAGNYVDTTSGIDTSTAYRYHRAVIGTAGGGQRRLNELEFYELTALRSEQVGIGSATIDAAATNLVTTRFDDGAGANASTKSTFRNRTGATRDIAFEVVL